MASPQAAKIERLHYAAQQDMRAGNLRSAHQHCLALLKIDPGFPDAWFFCGVIAAHNGQRDKAIEILTKAVELAPSQPEYRAELGKLQLVAERPEEALQQAQQALAAEPEDPPTLNTLGTIFSHLGEHDAALSCFEKAIGTIAGRAENNKGVSAHWQAELYFNTGASLQFAGQLDAAKQAYESAIARQPTLFKAHSALATLSRQTGNDNHLERLLSLRAQVNNARDQLHLGHALAKEQEDLGSYLDALHSLQWAKAPLANEVNYDSHTDQALLQGIRELFNREKLSLIEKGDNSEEPIFVVGMPRTGTTLIEQILGSHSLVYGAGELQTFPLQVKRQTQSHSSLALDPESLNRALTVDMHALGEAYIAGTRPRTGHTPHFVDKLPLNFAFLGLIHLALPRAKIICLRRDPMDTCLSNYRNMFASNFQHYYYNLDLLDCGRYYIEFDKLIRHWRNAIPGVVYEISYESLVSDTEDTVRGLLDYCGLPWEENCLAFHNSSAAVATPSAVQVRQSIYTSSVNRWEKFGDAMQPLLSLLQDAGLYD